MASCSVSRPADATSPEPPYMIGPAGGDLASNRSCTAARTPATTQDEDGGPFDSSLYTRYSSHSHRAIHSLSTHIHIQQIEIKSGVLHRGADARSQPRRSSRARPARWEEASPATRKPALDHGHRQSAISAPYGYSLLSLFVFFSFSSGRHACTSWRRGELLLLPLGCRCHSLSSETRTVRRICVAPSRRRRWPPVTHLPATATSPPRRSRRLYPAT